MFCMFWATAMGQNESRLGYFKTSSLLAILLRSVCLKWCFRKIQRSVISGSGLEGIHTLSRIAVIQQTLVFTSCHNHSKYPSLLLRSNCRHFVLFLSKINTCVCMCLRLDLKSVKCLEDGSQKCLSAATCRPALGVHIASCPAISDDHSSPARVTRLRIRWNSPPRHIYGFMAWKLGTGTNSSVTVVPKHHT